VEIDGFAVSKGEEVALDDDSIVTDYDIFILVEDVSTHLL
jgi:hypothetical protein